MTDSFVTAQPAPAPAMSSSTSFKDRLRHVHYKLTTKEGLIGDYSYGHLCMPSWPYSFGRRDTERHTRKLPPFYSLEADLPVLLTIVAGFQHSIAMLAGVITPPIIFANALNLAPEVQSYMISASLIASGILSAIQMSRIRLPIPFVKRDFFIGTGLITVVGTSFASLSSAFSIFNAFYSNGRCEPNTPCPEAWGALLGTSALCSLTEIGMSFVPAKTLRRLFPPIVTGLVVLLIGASLIGESGFLNWGGGSNDCHSRPETGFFALCPNIAAPKAALWGSPQFIGLGFLSFVTILLVEMFGSPFLRNASIIIGLAVGMIGAGAGGYVDGSSLASSPAITFTWTQTFPLSIYAPAILPFMGVYVAVAMEAIGDITASSEASRVEVEGPVFDSRIQGGVLADGVAGLLAALMTTSPMSIFAQNNGVISLTRCANRRAGYACACFMIIYGILGKVAGAFLSIPNSTLGGVTTFLFSQVAVSGLKVLSTVEFTRRNRFILASSLCFGLGNLLVPDFATHLFEGVVTTNSGLQGFFDAIVIVLSTPFLISAIVGVLLNTILPHDAEDEGATASLGSTLVHPDDLIGPAAAERELKDEIELDDKKFEHDASPHTHTLSREVV